MEREANLNSFPQTIAQTLGGKRTAWLLAILVALAVFATVDHVAGAGVVANGPSFRVSDAGSAQPPQTPTNGISVGNLNTFGSGINGTKTGPTTVPANGAPISYTITIANTNVGAT